MSRVRERRERVESGKVLTEKEKDYIREYYPKQSPKEISLKLGRINVSVGGKIIAEYMKANGFSAYQLRTKEKEEKEKDSFLGEVYDTEDLEFIEMALDHEGLLPEPTDIIRANEMARERKLRYFADKKESLTDNEFIKFIRLMGDYKNTYGDKFNMADDFQMVMTLCSSQISLDRQDRYEKDKDSRFSDKARVALIKSLNETRVNLGVSREQRLKTGSDTAGNIADISSIFSDTDAMRALEQEDHDDFNEMKDIYTRITDVAKKGQEGNVQDVESNSMFYGMTSEDIDKINPEQSDKYDKLLRRLVDAEVFITSEIFIDPAKVIKIIKEQCPKLMNLFHTILIEHSMSK